MPCQLNGITFIGKRYIGRQECGQAKPVDIECEPGRTAEEVAADDLRLRTLFTRNTNGLWAQARPFLDTNNPLDDVWRQNI